MQFKELGIEPLLLQSIFEQGYTEPTLIQKKAIPPLLQGKDLLGCAQTGTGKTAAFAIPILQKLGKKEDKPYQVNPIQALILAPTRELAIQIGESFTIYGKHLHIQTGVVYGGITPKRHIKVLKREPHILVATPGRLLDLFEQGFVDLSHVEMLVLDEADRMLDLGMIKDVKLILSKLPKARQNMLFSATMPKEVTKLVQAILKNPVSIDIKEKPSKKQETQQRVYFVEEPDKTALLLHLLKDKSFESVLVFVRTKNKADKISKAINIQNIRSKAIHGDKNQSERIKALESFKSKEVRVLVATDVAARGIDIDKLSHVINMDIPNVPENYIHRIGRTGRAGLSGTAISFCGSQELEFLKAIEQYQGTKLKVEKDNPYPIMHLILEQNREEFRLKNPKKGV
jgi:ATP-dependent RNA helicase RhlE